MVGREGTLLPHSFSETEEEQIVTGNHPDQRRGYYNADVIRRYSPRNPLAVDPRPITDAPLSQLLSQACECLLVALPQA